MPVTGHAGRVQVGYQLAASLHTWTLHRDGDESVIVSPWSAFDEYWWTQRPFTLHLPIGERIWVWRDAQLASTDPLTLRCAGSPESYR